MPLRSSVPAEGGTHQLQIGHALADQVLAGCQVPLRSTKSFLISPIALAGLRFFGQVLAQFMMVWQRYSLNGSSRSSRRAPVSSSRESAIQRYACSRIAGPRYLSLFHQ